MHGFRFAITSVLAIASSAQTVRTPAPPAVAQKVVSLADSGHCQEALPQLIKLEGHIQGNELKRKAGLAGVKCSMAANDASHAVSFLVRLNQEFPHDPAVLYLSSHVYSDLSLRASNELLSTAPASPQVHELNAEALETMGKWNEARDEYRAVLAKDPQMPGIHYRLGRLLLSQSDAPPTVREDAKREFEQELKIDPSNAGANFVLGELARQAEKWPEAIDYFSKATKFDASFVDAYLGLGRSFLGADKPADAIAPLETAVKLQPDNPMVHFELATAYQRTGRKSDADKEFIAHREAAQKVGSAKHNIEQKISGRPQDPAQTGTSPQ
jgi:Tfp pilus assembly protein PilF